MLNKIKNVIATDIARIKAAKEMADELETPRSTKKEIAIAIGLSVAGAAAIGLIACAFKGYEEDETA